MALIVGMLVFKAMLGVLLSLEGAGGTVSF
jgi:hypothetical protein